MARQSIDRRRNRYQGEIEYRRSSVRRTHDAWPDQDAVNARTSAWGYRRADSATNGYGAPSVLLSELSSQKSMH